MKTHMKISKTITSLLLCFVISSSVTAQSMLELYFNGNEDSLILTANQLIHTPEPYFETNENPTEIDPAVLADMGFEQVSETVPRQFEMSDHKRIFGYRFPKESPNTVVLLHGVASSAYVYNRTATLLREATQSEVYTIDLRGHGQSEGKSGDVDFINQYANDLAEIIAIIRKEKPGGKIILAGHSMGGGVILRYAMESNFDQPDGFLLFAPLIGHNSPAFHVGSSESESVEEPFMKIHFERIIGLTMLNEINNHTSDSLPVLFLNLPESMPLRSYSFRANASMAPDDYAAALQSVHKPMLVLIGTDDEVFSAEAMQSAVIENSAGEVKIIDEATHNGVRHSPQSFTFIEDWYSKL